MSENLHVETTGKGQDLILVHGWAMHGGVWPDVMIQKLSENYRVHRIDLPGHGLSQTTDSLFTIENITELFRQTIIPELESKAIVIGWSLGGLVSADFTLQYPEVVNKLILIASSLRFTKTVDWVDAIDKKILKLFADNLIDDYEQTLSRFLALQFNGDDYARQGLRELKQKVFACKTPDVKVLKQGLEILLTADLREQALDIECPVLFIGGEHDTLTPAAALSEMAKKLPDAKTEIIKGASHAPFISHQAEFYNRLMGFVHG